jgi:hypothetical protein
MRLTGRRVAPDRDDDPVAVFLRELDTQLRPRGLARRRIAKEVRAHLEDSIEGLEHESELTRSSATEETLARFGNARQLAAQFNALPTRRSVAARRLAVLWIAWLGAMGMGSATVWASFDASAAAGGSQHRTTVIRTVRPLCTTTDAGRQPVHSLSSRPERCR